MQKKKKHKNGILLCCIVWLLFISVMPSSAAQNLNTMKVSLDLKEATVKEFFDAVKKQTNLNFIYNSELTKGLSRITIKSVNQPVRFVLDKVMQDTDCMYEIDGNIVTVTYQQNGKLRKLTGIVLDDENLGIPGVNIYIKNTKFHTITDMQGRYSIEIPTNECKVTFSYIGMKTQDILFKKGNENIKKDIKLVSDTKIDEVVVTGIVVKKKSSFTGSASSFSGEELKAAGVQNPIASLKSLDPSFNVLDNSAFGADPNHLPNIEIRGKSSMLGIRDELSEDPNQPLFILDGFESSLQAIYNLDINRIASMTILKDAASTAIYGSKAANGVVVVETVKPKTGQLRLSYNGSMDISFPDLTSYNLMNSREKLEFEKKFGKYSGKNASATDIVAWDDLYQKHLADINSGVDTYWLSEPLRTGLNHRHSMYVDGGSGGFMFGIGLNYNGVNGVMKKSDRQVYGGNLDLIYRLGKLQFTNKFTAQQTNYNNPTVPFSDYALASPYYKKYNEEGEIDKFLADNKFEGKIGNPLYNDALNSRDETNNLTLTDYFMAEYTPLKDLKIRARAGLTTSINENELFFSPEDTQFAEYNTLKKGLYTYKNVKQTRLEGEFTTTYATVLKDVHRINVSLGGNIWEQKSVLQGYSAQGFPSGDFAYPSFSNGYVEGGHPAYSESLSRSVSGYLIGGYSLKDRYLLDASYRLNGSSVFGSNKKFIGTWSVGLGWNLHNEQFIKNNLSFINYFKIRGSIGNPGNQNFSSSMSLTTFNYSFASYNYFGMGTVLTSLGNANLKWQTTLDKNIGLDLVLLDNRLNLNLDYYHKKTDPLLIAIGLPASSGVSSYNTNLGNQISKGFTGMVQYYLLRDFEKRLTWSLRGTVRIEKSKLGGIGDSLESLNDFGQTNKSVKRYYDGSDPDDIWAVRSAGIDPANGRELFIKKDGTYTYDFTNEDEVVVGNTRPKAEGTFGSNFSYKGFTIAATFRYRWGGKSFNNAVYEKVENISSKSISTFNQDKRALYERWQKAGDVAMFKNIIDASNTPMSSRFVQKENTLTLESFSVGYEFDPIFVRRLGVSGMRLNAYMNEIFRTSTIKQERGSSYPHARSVSFALSFTL